MFFDATYEEQKTSTLDLLERLKKQDKRYTSVSFVLLGRDILGNRNTDFETNYLVSRTESLPRKLYGGREGTKIDVIIDTILRYARDNNLKVDKKLPEGELREDILDKITPYMQTLYEMVGTLDRLKKQGVKISEEFIPENEEERIFLVNLRRELNLIGMFRHALGQTVMPRNNILTTARMRKENRLKDKEEEQKE